MSDTFVKLSPYLEKERAIASALVLFEWDTQTLAPHESGKYTSKTVGVLSEEYYQTILNPEVGRLLNRLEEEEKKGKLNDKERAIRKRLKKEYEKLKSMSVKEYRDFNELTTRAVNEWSKAKEKGDFKEFTPTLKKIVDYRRRFAEYRVKKGEKPYNILLDDFEPGFDMERLDALFDRIRKEIVPLIPQAAKQSEKIDKTYNHKEYDVGKLKEFCRYISGYLGFDFNRGVMAESAHPFTTNLHNHDVRITNHYGKNNLESPIFSAIHETGHALYEMGIADDLTQTMVGEGTSMGMHESQSRFYENIIGKSLAFWEPLYPKLVEFFGEQLSEIDLERFVIGMNKTSPGAIRIDADELTYPVHILIRYEIEKTLMEGSLQVEDLPEVWNRKYKEYLGVEPEDDGKGVLQDIHWAGGDFGYFPSYVVGSAVASQIYHHMKGVMPFEEYLREGNLTPVREYLRDAIHKYGATKETDEILKDMMNETFNPDYYIEYLKKKFNGL